MSQPLPAADPLNAPDAPARSDTRGGRGSIGWRTATPWLVFASFVIATIARGTAPFYWDADTYWQATLAIVGEAPAVPPGYWDLRGFWTALVYAPAAAATRVFGIEHAGMAVLIQNSIVFGATAAALLPALMSTWRRVNIPMLWAAGILFWLVTSGFAPFPLVDVYPVIGVLSLLLLLRTRGWWALLIAGVVAGIAFNLRPVYLVVVALVAIVTLVWRRWSGLLFPAGIIIALIPQLALNLSQAGQWSLVPFRSGSIAVMQAAYSTFVVRYDTIFGEAEARQFYCSPEMARLIGDHPPRTAGELVWSFVGNMPTSIQFAAEKVAASTTWQVSIPYAAPLRAMDVVFGVGIAALTVAGITALLYFASRRTGLPPRRDWYGVALIAAIVGATVGTLVGSATESRFALTLASLGVVGIALLCGPWSRSEWRAARWWALASVIITLLVLLLAHTGTDNPAPRGEANITICAAT